MNIFKHKLARLQRHCANRHCANRHDANRHGANRHGANRHGANRHGANRHGANRHGFKRHGLSVIEVLTSIIVALIGVFGVMAMIPFSVKQTQSGLDHDAATSMARNALSNFEASGYKIVSDQVDASGSPTGLKQLNWIDNAGNNVTTQVTPDTSLLCIDPLGVNEASIASFPFHNEKLDAALALPNGLPPFTIDLTIPTVTLSRPGGTPFDLADARRMFRLTDDLVFAESDDPNITDPNDTDSDLLGPQQLFNEGPNGLLNRQSNGTVSWCAIAHPHIADPNAAEVDSYKFYVLVFKDRLTEVDTDPTVADGKMAAALVTSAQSASVTFATPDGLDEGIRRDDWVMLINQETGSDPVAHRTNVAFARITNLYSNEPAGTSSLSIDGPDFNFPTGTDTYIVHLRDVVAVFPRTIKLETLSGWNVSGN